MKKKTRKLALHRETISDLQNQQLQNILGGAATEVSCANTGCDTATRFACGTTACSRFC